MHVIRLRGPWDCQLTADADDAQRSLFPSVRFPAAAGLTAVIPPTFVGRAALSRVFHAPSGLDSLARVELVFGVSCSGQLWLNQEPLGSFVGGPVRRDVTPRLQPNNRLCIELHVDGRGLAPSPWEVQLEIAAHD